MPEATGLANFPFDAVNSGIAIGYKNEDYIADMVLPRKTVGKQAFWWMKYADADGFTIPNTLVGRRGALNEVRYSKDRVQDECVAYGLKDRIPWEDVQNQDAGEDVIGESVEFTMDLIMLDREIRVYNTLSDLDLYPTDNKVTLDAANQWSNYASADSTPIEDINTARRAMRSVPNYAACGFDVAEVLCSHPDIVSAINKNDGTKGVVTIEQVAALFRLKKIFVGTNWVNVAAEGQTEDFVRVWGTDFILFHRNDQASFRRGITFGMTAQWGNRVAGTKPYDDEGLNGGTEVRVGEYVKETVLVPAAGYLVKSAIASS